MYYLTHLACLFALLASCFSMRAQTVAPTQQSIAKLQFIRPEGPGLWDLSTYGKVTKAEGTPYWNDGWTTGRIRFGDQPEFSETLNVLLDLEKNELYIRLETGFVGEFPMEMLGAVEVHSPADTMVYETFHLRAKFAQGDAGHRFYSVLHRGDNYTVLHQPVKYLRREEYIENLGMVRRPDKYMDTNKYWVIDGTQLVEVKKNVRQLSGAFPAKASAIKRLVKEHQLDLDKDLGRLFQLLEEE